MPPLPPDANLPADPESPSTGLPLISTWPRVYAFVLACFAITVVLLLWLTRAFS